jgi:hypothetical protein
MRVLLIDAYDSFVYIIEQYLATLGCDTCVIRNDIIDADLLPVGPSFIVRVLDLYIVSVGATIAGDRRSWLGLRSRSPADWMSASFGVRPAWAECGRTPL